MYAQFRSLGYGRLEKVWPTLNPTFWRKGSSAAFWTHEWNKHGICSNSTLNALQYFQSAIAQKDNIDLLQALRAAPYNINPSPNINYSRSDIEKAVSQRIGAQAYISCGLLRNSVPLLYEIYICLDYHMTNYINCPQYNYGRQCPADATHPNINFPPY
ncbi:ribonuclease 1-like [Cornus florida]|uniref:ribonuclease 1-like n=1 Tax=Cornus florida TaxID=4283 RepID=UPI00289B12A2|nr:ribonuclease 1-like [Cornus florida]